MAWMDRWDIPAIQRMLVGGGEKEAGESNDTFKKSQ